MAAYGTANLSGLGGKSLESAFHDAYGENLRDVEDAWETWLRSRPAEVWNAPVHFLFARSAP